MPSTLWWKTSLLACSAPTCLNTPAGYPAASDLLATEPSRACRTGSLHPARTTRCTTRKYSNQPTRSRPRAKPANAAASGCCRARIDTMRPNITRRAPTHRTGASYLIYGTTVATTSHAGAEPLLVPQLPATACALKAAAEVAAAEASATPVATTDVPATPVAAAVTTPAIGTGRCVFLSGSIALLPRAR